MKESWIFFLVPETWQPLRAGRAGVLHLPCYLQRKALNWAFLCRNWKIDFISMNQVMVWRWSDGRWWSLTISSSKDCFSILIHLLVAFNWIVCLPICSLDLRKRFLIIWLFIPQGVGRHLRPVAVHDLARRDADDQAPAGAQHDVHESEQVHERARRREEREDARGDRRRREHGLLLIGRPDERRRVDRGRCSQDTQVTNNASE